jgi:uncharacterized peroxidase-related enzyme
MFLSNPTADDAVQALFREAESEDGYVMNFLRLWAWRPDVHVAFNETRQLLASTTLLSEREVAILNSTTASRSGDAYCSISWGTKLAGLCDAAMAAALLRGDDTPAFTPRERALVAWASAVVENPNRTTREDVQVLRVAGLSDREIFEATLFVTFRLAFMTVNDALGAQPDRQLAQAAPTVVLESVTFGRTVHDRSIESQP